MHVNTTQTKILITLIFIQFSAIVNANSQYWLKLDRVLHQPLSDLEPINQAINLHTNRPHKTTSQSAQYDESEDKEIEDETVAGDLSLILNAEFASNLKKSEGETIDKAMTANIYSLLSLQLTDTLDIKLESSIDTQGDGKYFALKKPILFIDSLALAYHTDVFGVGIGKFDLLSENDLVSPIWGRQLSVFNSLPDQYFDLGGAIGVRGWVNLDEIFDQYHSLYIGAFFLDDTRLGKPFLNNYIEPTDDLSGVGYNKRLNNWMMSLHGDIASSDWSYSAGLAQLKKTTATEKNELSFFTGVYGEIELPSNFSLSPYVEFLYQDGVDGENQKSYAGLAGVSYDDNKWYYGGSVSYRRLKDLEFNKSSEDKEAQIYVSYYFDFGGYLDLGYQYISEDDTNNNLFAVYFGMPLEFNTNLYGKTKTKAKEVQRNDIKKVIRR